MTLVERSEYLPFLKVPSYLSLQTKVGQGHPTAQDE